MRAYLGLAVLVAGLPHVCRGLLLERSPAVGGLGLEVVELVLALRDCDASLLGLFLEPLRGPLVELGVEEAAEQGLALVRAGSEHLLELALGE